MVVNPHPTDHCAIPALPLPPVLDPRACGASVCLTQDETVSLARWITLVNEVRSALTGCSLVTIVPQ